MASQNIAFDAIPSSIRKPGKYAEFNTALAVRTLPGNLQKTLIVGQRLASGSVAANTVVDVFSDEEAAAYFGRGSLAHRMVMAALRANPYLSLEAIALDDAASGLAAHGTVTITGPANTAGVLTLRLGGDKVQIAIAVGDVQNAIAAALKAQFDAQPDLPVTAAVVNNVVTLTAKNKGLQGNGIHLAASCSAANVTAAVGAMAGGDVDPDVTTAMATVFSAGHNVIVCPWNDATSLQALRDHLEAVAGPLEKRGAVGIYAKADTLALATTLAGDINGGRVTGIVVPGAYEMSCEIAAIYGAIVAFEEDPARPLNGLTLPGVTVPPIDKWLSRTEQENALNNGVTPTEVGPGGTVQIVRAITTYTVNATGTPDIALLDLTTIRTLDYTRKAIVDRLSLRFPRSKKTARVMRQIREEVLDVLYKLESLEILENVKANEDGVIVEEDLQDPNRVNVRIPSDVVNGLHVVGIRIDLLL